VPKTMTPRLLELVADRFKVLADPARLRLLSLLRPGERTVSELVQQTGLSQANVSKHLGVLHAAGFVARRKEGLYSFYSLADKRIFRLCDLMCDRLEAETEGRTRMFAGGP
jgi:DNA-binding transcriptional ArsR family regulator